MKISLIKCLLNNEERYIIQVNVEESRLKPVVLNPRDIPSIFMRRDGFTNGATYEEIIDMSIESKNYQHDILSLELSLMNSKVIDITSQFSIIPVPDRTELDEKVLSFCYHKPHKVLEIAEYLGISDSTYLRKQVLENMVKNAYLEKSKISRSAFYKTNRDVVEIL